MARTGITPVRIDIIRQVSTLRDGISPVARLKHLAVGIIKLHFALIQALMLLLRTGQDADINPHFMFLATVPPLGTPPVRGHATELHTAGHAAFTPLWWVFSRDCSHSHERKHRGKNEKQFPHVVFVLFVILLAADAAVPKIGNGGYKSKNTPPHHHCQSTAS